MLTYLGGWLGGWVGGGGGGDRVPAKLQHARSKVYLQNITQSSIQRTYKLCELNPELSSPASATKCPVSFVTPCSPVTSLRALPSSRRKKKLKSHWRLLNENSGDLVLLPFHAISCS